MYDDVDFDFPPYEKRAIQQRNFIKDNINLLNYSILDFGCATGLYT